MSKKSVVYTYTYKNEGGGKNGMLLVSTLFSNMCKRSFQG